MFNWLFDNFRTPAPTREDVEQNRIYKKNLYDAAAHAILQEMIKKDQVKIPKPVSMEGFFKNWQKEVEHPNCKCILPKPKIPLVLVPLSDYEIMKIIRVGWALGEGTTNLPIEESGYTENEENETHYNNAKILHECYGMSKDKLFQLTGCVLNDDI